MDTLTVEQKLQCRNCGEVLAGAFCHRCGEPRPDPRELSWKHFVHHGVHEFSHVDSKIFRTLWLLIRRPGFLTAEYWAGRRTAYIRPLRLYLVIAAIHLIAVSSTYYRLDFFQQNDPGGTMQRFVERLAARDGVSTQVVEEAINRRLHTLYSVLQYGAVAGFAWIPMLIYRRRVPRYVPHLIFALHVYSVYFLIVACVSRILTAAQWRRSPAPLILLVYLFFAVRRLYGESGWRSAWKAVVLRIGLFAAEFVVLALAISGALFWAHLSIG